MTPLSPPTFSGGARRTIELAQPPAHAPAVLAQALAAGGATVVGTGAHLVAFTAARRSARSFWINVRYRGVAELAPSVGGSTAVTLRAKPEPVSLAIVSVMIVGVLLALVLLGNGGQLTPDSPAGSPADYEAGKPLGALVFFGGLGVGIPYLLLSRGGSRRMLDTLLRAVATSAPMGTVPPVAAVGGEPTLAPAAVDGIFAQLRELGTLRDQGILSAAEHDQARAALLARIA